MTADYEALRGVMAEKDATIHDLRAEVEALAALAEAMRRHYPNDPLWPVVDAEEARADAAEAEVERLREHAARLFDEGSRARAEVERLRGVLDVAATWPVAAEAAVARVRALHIHIGSGMCRTCPPSEPYPCATIRALDGAES